jgi:tetraacyldisaccharide 4'-kinase
LNPLSALFGGIVGSRNRLYDRGTFRANWLRGPVVSVGSISAGGAGKTPFLIMLGELLKERGVAFDVLSRGYGRKTTGLMVDPDGSPQEFGDEPLLIAHKLGVSVIVGEERYEAGLFAEDKFGQQLHLLDDGFQHRQLGRDFDIVLVTPHDLQDSLLPVGRLREPLSSLSRASAVVFVDGAVSDRLPGVQGQYLWRVSRSIAPPKTTAPCFAFCGIARPQGFFAELRAAGINVVGTREFRDHHAYSAADVELLLRLRQEAGASEFVTTEKDAVNLSALLLPMQPIHIVPVRLQFEPSSGANAGPGAAALAVEQLCGVIRHWDETRMRE